ncbi:MAG: hypothetical protein GVY18_02770 [Bacteroidetes bacterium]|jgi:hypothetical protein|nr:hypothetical protein [Bacteroidota bacterium]
MLRLYLDEDAMSRALVQGLRARGVDVLTVAEAGRAGQDDGDQLQFAAERGRVLYTFNVADFCRLHEAYMHRGMRHAGIVVVPRQRYGVGAQVRKLSELVRTHSS